MIALCTGRPVIKQDGDRIIATIPSGNGEVEIALNFGQATCLGEGMVRLAREAVSNQNIAASAKILPLKRKTKRGA
ncbi:hypothetical protein A9995_00695 [Erythrobacter sp. QSSC1-22B]|uniref:hypothetical protein n=1 Tax=Erythrobacter sp. QSSC1-22B TaxID=1860125 RepID=UPI00080518CF|nr:hypothetical protein [Erythrobacter sp. QSSC1-22B]OBX20284.1 hypothetical protein A9995_00695 [Erythrobacter sp. QSSC1-22B]